LSVRTAGGVYGTTRLDASRGASASSQCHSAAATVREERATGRSPDCGRGTGACEPRHEFPAASLLLDFR
jgi:hypothetical protein